MQIDADGGDVLPELARFDAVTDGLEKVEQLARDQMDLAEVGLLRVDSDS